MIKGFCIKSDKKEVLSAGLERMLLAYCFCYASTDDNMLALNLKYVPTMLQTSVEV